MTDVAGRVARIIFDQLGVDEDRVTPEARLVEDLSADSIDVVELVMRLEEEFHVDITDEECETIVTVHDVSELIAGKTS